MSKLEDLSKLQELYPKGCIAEIYFDESTVKVLKTEAGVLNEQSRQN